MNASTPPSEASPLLDVQRDARGVVRLTLNDPQRFNALGEQMLTQLQQALDEFRVLISGLKTAGK